MLSFFPRKFEINLIYLNYCIWIWVAKLRFVNFYALKKYLKEKKQKLKHLFKTTQEAISSVQTASSNDTLSGAPLFQPWQWVGWVWRQAGQGHPWEILKPCAYTASGFSPLECLAYTAWSVEPQDPLGQIWHLWLSCGDTDTCFLCFCDFPLQNSCSYTH